MTFPIQKRNNTEPFIDGKHELYIQKRQIKNSWLDLSERVVTTSEHICHNVGMKTHKKASKQTERPTS